MTRTRLAVFCAIGALMWGGLFAALSEVGIGIDWRTVAKCAVVAVIVVFGLSAMYLTVKEDEDRIEFERMTRRESKALDIDEYEESLPPAA